MDSLVPSNEEVPTISQDSWEAIPDRLIELAKSHADLRTILLQALLNPKFCLSEPRIPMQRLLTALRVADLAGSTVYGRRGDKSALDRWHAIKDFLITQLRTQLVSGRPFSARQARELRFCLAYLQPSWELYMNVDWGLVEEDLNVLEDTGKTQDGFIKSYSARPRRGRSLTLQQQRIIASVELLRQCGVRDPSQKVIEALFSSWEITREAKTVLNLWSGYKKYRRRFPEREAMPYYHLKAVLWLLRPAVKAWEKKTGVSVVASKVSEPNRPSTPRRRSG